MKTQEIAERANENGSQPLSAARGSARRSIFDDCPNCLGRGYIYWGSVENPRGCKCERCEGTGQYFPLPEKRKAPN